MSFFSALTSTLEQNLSIGENTNRSLDILKDGNVQQYGSLGKFSEEFDQSARLGYNEQGYVRVDTDQIKPNNTEIFFQQPTYTVLVKKKMFSSLAENFTSNYADKDERLFIRATKILFANKCKQIAAYEKLCVIQNFVSQTNTVQNQVIPLIYSLINTLASSDKNGDIKSVLDRVKKIYSLNKTENQTEWLTDSSNVFNTIFGEGTGVIELSNLVSISTRSSLEGDGSASFAVQDPYELMIINERDINKALYDASNLVKSNKYVTIGIDTVEDIIKSNLIKLKELRSNRGVSDIEIKINPETLYGKRVTALLGSGTEILFTYNAALGAGSIANLFDSDKSYGTIVPEEYQLRSDKNAYGKEALDKKELDLFKSIIESVFRKIAITINLEGASSTANKDQNYARRKLSMYFLGKTIIQNTDPVFVYINSKTVEDNTILAGIKTSFSERVSFKENLNHSLGDLKNSWNALFSPKKDVSVQIEKSVFVGPDFPDSLWASLKSLFTNEVEGTCVFGGLIDNVSTSWSRGVFTANVNCKSNMDYLSKGAVNFNPSVDTYNGAIYDPLTPFKTNFDSIIYNSDNELQNLLPENEEMLSKASAKAGAGVHKEFNKGIDEAIDCSVDAKNNKITRKFYAPDGFVYKWKQGVGIFTYDGSSFSREDADYLGSPNIYEDAFAGQDVMNVFSLLITGQPYNYNTYFKATSETGKQDVDSKTFLSALRGELNKRNVLWGNFIPFKNYTNDPNTFTAMLQNQTAILNSNKKLNEAISKVDNIYNKAIKEGGSDRGLTDAGNEKIKDYLIKADQIGKEVLDAEQKDYDSKADKLQIVGSSIQFDTESSLSDNITSFEARKKVNYLTRRMSWSVKANEDKNLFIVDDSYDSDQDLIAFGTKLNGNLSSLDNSYLSIKEKLNTISSMFGGVEFFCDSQGHIRVRAPQYNKMPSSVFLRLVEQSKRDNINFLPTFISELYSKQSQDLKTSIEVTEDYIRVYTTAIGKDTDSTAENFIKGFQFISDETGNINNAINTNKLEEDNSFKNIKAQNSVKKLFTPIQKTQAFLSLIPTVTQSSSLFNTYKTRALEIVRRIEIKSSQKVNINEVFGLHDRPNYALILDKLSNYIEQRQRLLNKYEKSLKNESEAKYLDEGDTDKLLFPGFENNQIPDVFSSFIEDEKFDDYGPNSGSRYVIRNANIIDYQINENAPKFTCTQVNGQIDLTLSNVPENLPGPATLGGQASNGMVTATAIDYDMYRMYGVLQSHPVNIAMFSDPQTQCAPYAYSLLARARKNIFEGSISVPINEYYQIGDVIYLEPRNMLFYVTDVAHNISYGSYSKTTLTIKYGHVPGELIPNMLDITGKLLYNNRDKNDLAIDRQSSVIDTYLGTFFVGNENVKKYNKPGANINLFSSSSIGTQNQKTYQKVIYNALYKIQHNDKKYKLQLRSYKYNSNLSTNYMDTIKKTLTDVLVGKKETGFLGINQNTKKDNAAMISPADIVVSVEVDLNDSTEQKRPSQQAYDFVRAISDSDASSDTYTFFNQGVNDIGKSYSNRNDTTNRLFSAMQFNVIDCYLVEDK